MPKATGGSYASVSFGGKKSAQPTTGTNNKGSQTSTGTPKSSVRCNECGKFKK